MNPHVQHPLSLPVFRDLPVTSWLLRHEFHSVATSQLTLISTIWLVFGKILMTSEAACITGSLCSNNVAFLSWVLAFKSSSVSRYKAAKVVIMWPSLFTTLTSPWLVGVLSSYDTWPIYIFMNNNLLYSSNRPQTDDLLTVFAAVGLTKQNAKTRPPCITSMWVSIFAKCLGWNEWSKPISVGKDIQAYRHRLLKFSLVIWKQLECLIEQWKYIVNRSHENDLLNTELTLVSFIWQSSWLRSVNRVIKEIIMMMKNQFCCDFFLTKCSKSRLKLFEAPCKPEVSLDGN